MKSGRNVITWKNMTANRIIFAGTVNVINDDRLMVEGKGRRMHFNNITEFDAGVLVCTVEAAHQIKLEHRLNVLSKLIELTL